MTMEKIEAFLSIVEYGSITKAAEHLYISQPALSHRLNELEKELGVSLLIRRKGVTRAELTPQGNTFVLQAQKWIQLWQETASALQSGYVMERLSLSASNSLINSLLPPLFAQLKTHDLPAKISMVMANYSDAYREIANGSIDFAFLTYPSTAIGIETIPIGKEKMLFLCAPDSDYPDTVTPEQLDPTREAFLSWSPDFLFWHDHCFGTSQEPFIRSNHYNLVKEMVLKFGAWAIMPQTITETMAGQGLRVCEIEPPPPPRMLYVACRSDNVHKYYDLVLADIRKVVEEQTCFTPI